jgi:uncharacterized protein YutE (UPF0331/DUF86 family)
VKQEILKTLQEFKSKLSKLRKQLKEFKGTQVAKLEFRNAAQEIATDWVENIRSPLEHKFKIDRTTIEATAEQMKRLHQLARPNNQKSSYLACLDLVLTKFDDNFILPIQQTASAIDTVAGLHVLIPTLRDADVSDYLVEAIKCADAGFNRAAVVMGWCAAINRVQRKLVGLGFDAFNRTSSAIKAQTSGKYKRWNKEFNVTSEAELQAIFDTDLIAIIENMGLIDGNESQRLETCFQYRNHSAHPGAAPIEQPHVVSFFTDITKIILTNPKFG